MKNFLRRYGVTMAWAALLFVLSSIPDLALPVEVFSWDDKIHHALAYTPLGWLLLRSIVWKSPARRRDFRLAILIGGLYGMCDELHQHFVPGRFMDWTDAAADTAGVIFGGWIFFLWHERQIKRQQKNVAPMPRKKIFSN